MRTRHSVNVLGLALIMALFLPPPQESRSQSVRQKNSTIAFGLSGLGTLVPGTVVYYRLTDGTAGLDAKTFAILAAGGILGPALGHFYTENHDRAWNGITLRLVAGLASTAGVYAGILTALGGGNPIIGAVLFVGGIVVTGVSVVRDIVGAPASASAWNERHGLAVYPIFDAPSSGVGATILIPF